jgi:hypothetical protein
VAWSATCDAVRAREVGRVMETGDPPMKEPDRV